MTTRHVCQVLGGALLLSLACAAMAQPDGSVDAKSSTNATDSTFMQHAAADGLAEVQLGQMALNKSSDAQVKQLAQHIVDDHTKANDQLKALAQSKQVTLPTAPTSDAQKESKDLQAKNGSSFDQAWLKDMVKNHQAAVKAFTQESKQAKDPDVHQFAQTTLPTLNTHLQMATKLAAIPDARDKAMDQTTKSMAGNPMSSMPTTAAPTATTPASDAPSSAIKH
jgi:putative membrane protein